MESATGIALGFGEKANAKSFAERIRQSKRPEISENAEEIAQAIINYGETMNNAAEKLAKEIMGTTGMSAPELMAVFVEMNNGGVLFPE